MEDNNYFTINSEIFQRMCDMGDAELKKFLQCEKWWRAAFIKAEATRSRLLVNRFERLHDEWNDETQTQFAAKLGKCKSWDEVEEKAAAAEKKANEADFDRTGDVLNEESRRYKEYIKNQTKALAVWRGVQRTPTTWNARLPRPRVCVRLLRHNERPCHWRLE
jgi:hypothetical protein